jgi:hypothetical protein
MAGLPPTVAAAAAAMGIEGDDEMVAQASQLWEMMDEMASSNPEA